MKSPTFSILEEYNVGNLEIYHADLYRLNNPNDFEMLGFEPNFSKKKRSAVYRVATNFRGL